MDGLTERVQFPDNIANFFPLTGRTSKFNNDTEVELREISEDLVSFIANFDSIVLVAFGSYYMSPMPLLLEIAEVSKRFEGSKLGFVFTVHENHRAYIHLEEMVSSNFYLSKMTALELLAEPKLKLWITHCGQSPGLESIYFGVPILGFPLTPE